MTHFRFEELAAADLCVDAVYQGGRSGNSGDDPFPRLLGVSNMGGFRYLGTLEQLQLLVLTSSKVDPDWPDGLDPETGVFTYYGDNKHPGRALHDTPRFGNEILRRLFASARDEDRRHLVPPVLVFESAGEYRDVVFRGLAIPCTTSAQSDEDLVAIWKSNGGRRFQNYRARFTILDEPVVSRAWLRLSHANRVRSPLAPRAWVQWVKLGKISPLHSRPSLAYRTRSEQLPHAAEDVRLLSALHAYFRSSPVAFERCAAYLTSYLLGNVTSLDLTRPTRDGGRDAIGSYRIGRNSASIAVTFAIEAKCYSRDRRVGVRETSRLISRLIHRQFGVLVTTSYIDLQAYKEIIQDGHPILVMSGADIVGLLRDLGVSSPAALKRWLRKEFPIEADPDLSSEP